MRNLVGDDEAERTVVRENYYAIRPSLPEFPDCLPDKPALSGKYSSKSNVMNREQLMEMLARNELFVEDEPDFSVMLGTLSLNLASRS